MGKKEKPKQRTYEMTELTYEIQKKKNSHRNRKLKGQGRIIITVTSQQETENGKGRKAEWEGGREEAEGKMRDKMEQVDREIEGMEETERARQS